MLCAPLELGRYDVIIWIRKHARRFIFGTTERGRETIVNNTSFATLEAVCMISYQKCRSEALGVSRGTTQEMGATACLEG